MKFFKKIINLFSIDPLPQASLQSNPAMQKKFDDLGNFKYEDDGFILQFDNGAIKIKWTDIERLVAYKVDLMTVDEIRMDLIYNNRQTVITEETPGWYQFVLKTKSVFKEIPPEWDLEIIQPPFATNLTVLYEREDRIMPKENNFYASFKNLDKITIKTTLENNGWSSRKAGFTDFEFVNSWAELVLEGDDNSPLLSGRVAYNPNSIELLENIFNSMQGEYTYEFYDEQKKQGGLAG